MDIDTTTDTTDTDSIRTSFEIVKNLYEMSIQVDEITNKENRKNLRS